MNFCFSFFDRLEAKEIQRYRTCLVDDCGVCKKSKTVNRGRKSAKVLRKVLCLVFASSY